MKTKLVIIAVLILMGVWGILSLTLVKLARAEEFDSVYAYVTNVVPNNVSVVDLASNAAIQTISLPSGTQPYDIRASSDGEFVYVAGYGSDTVVVIETDTRTVAATITGFADDVRPMRLALTPDNTKLYASEFMGGRVAVIDTASRMITKEISGFSTPYGLTVSPDGRKLYVADDGHSGAIYVVDVATDTLEATIAPSGATPTDGAFVAILPDSSKAYVTHIYSAEVSVIDLANRVFLASVSNWPNLTTWGLAANSDGTKIYVADLGTNEISIIDVASNSWVKDISLGSIARAVTFSPGSSRAYAVHGEASGQLAVIDTASESVLTTTTVGAGPQSVAIVDKSKPAGSIRINEEASRTTSADVTLNFSASDNNGVSEMMISNRDDFSGAAWETYVASREWTLSSGYGTKTVYAKFRNPSGNESATASDTIELEKPMIVTAPRQGGGPQVRVWEWSNNKVSATKVSFMAYAASFRGGVNVAYGDVNGDGRFEIVTAPGPTGGPQVKVWDRNGKLLSQFMAYPSAFRGGVKVAVGDLDGNGTEEIITGPQSIGTPQVRVFDLAGHTKFTAGFFAYDKSFKGGVNVTAGDVNRDGKDEIITGAGLTGSPQVRVFDKTGKSVSTPGFLAYDSKFRGGVAVSSADLNGDGKWEILTAPGQSGGANVRVFNSAGKPSVSGGYNAWKSNEPGARSGISISATDFTGDGKAEVMGGAGIGGQPKIRFFDILGNKKPGSDTLMYASSFLNGINVASHSL